MLYFNTLNEYFDEFLIHHKYLLIEFFSGFIPFLFCLYFFKAIWLNNRPLIFYSISILFLELIGGYYSAISKANHIIYLIFYLFETIVLFIFYFNFQLSKRFNWALTILMIIISIAIIYNIFNGIGLMDNFSGSIQSIGLIGITVFSFYIILSKMEIQNLMKSTLFWINTGNLVYFSGRFFVFLFIVEVMSEKNFEQLDGYWYIVSILLLIHRIFLAIGISQSKHLIKK